MRRSRCYQRSCEEALRKETVLLTGLHWAHAKYGAVSRLEYRLKVMMCSDCDECPSQKAGLSTLSAIIAEKIQTQSCSVSALGRIYLQ